jgi:hypothetical protein
MKVMEVVRILIHQRCMMLLRRTGCLNGVYAEPEASIGLLSQMSRWYTGVRPSERSVGADRVFGSSCHWWKARTDRKQDCIRAGITVVW